jgi:hypothetical protein
MIRFPSAIILNVSNTRPEATEKNEDENGILSCSNLLELQQYGVNLSKGTRRDWLKVQHKKAKERVGENGRGHYNEFQIFS